MSISSCYSAVEAYAAGLMVGMDTFNLIHKLHYNFESLFFAARFPSFSNNILNESQNDWEKK